ncbi:hypothetical protein DKG34_29045 [Streptomyces sp. NWU49]|nr:hypothetical protein DKG34_29045 [Streptomyces sp. NWU49]
MELRCHHAVEPGVNAPEDVTGEGLVQRPPNQDTRARRRPPIRGGQHVPPPLSTPRGVSNLTCENELGGAGIQPSATERIPSDTGRWTRAPTAGIPPLTFLHPG